jgi:formyl-CoA transferase
MLAGIRVVELAEGVAGPLAACRLADLGATVVKIESGDGDWTRGCPPFIDDDATSAVFFALNRGKRSLALGSAPAAAGHVLRRLLENADVFITDRGAAALAPLGLTGVHEDPCPLNPRLITASISAFGEAGPLADRPGSELGAQAMAGYTRYLGAYARPARRLGADVAGAATATFATQAILAALLYRTRAGHGQRVSLSLLNSLLSMKTVHLAAQSDPDEYAGPRVGGANDPPERGWATADSPITFMFGGAVGREGRPGWAQFVEEIGLGRLLDDPRFDKTGRLTTGLGPTARALKGEYEQEFVTLSRGPGRRDPEARGLAELLTHEQVFADPQARALELVRQVPAAPGDDVPVLAFPGRFSRTRLELRGHAPTLGQHTVAVATELGLSASQIDELRHTLALRAPEGAGPGAAP